MKIDEIHFVTTIVRRMRGDRQMGSASGFFHGIEDRVYLITNKHVICGDSFGSENPEPDIDTLKINLHTNAENVTQNEEVSIELFEDEEPIWLEHSNNQIDIVAIPVDLDRSHFIFYTTNSELLEADNLKVRFEKVFVMGYPHGWHDIRHNLPVTRVGHLSSPFLVPFSGNPYMLIDVETHPGMSGSPVFMHLSNYQTVDSEGKVTTHLGAWKLVLAGVYSGQPRWPIEKEDGTTEEIPHTLGVVWFGDLIRQIINEE